MFEWGLGLEEDGRETVKVSRGDLVRMFEVGIAHDGQSGWMLWLALLVPLCYGAPRIATPCAEENSSDYTTPGYRIASDILTKSINFSVDPCDDFFEFSCGNWIASHPIPSHKTSYSQFGNLSDKVQEEMRDIFESPEIFGSKSMMALKKMYRKCMDKDELNRIGARRLIDNIRVNQRCFERGKVFIVLQSYGVWPMLEGDSKWQSKDFDLTSLLIHVTEVRDLDVFVATYITLDNKNVTRRLIEFDQAELGLGDSTRDYYLDRAKHGKKIEAYKQFLINKMRLIHEDANIPFNEEKTTSDVDEIIELETKLAKIIVPEEDRRDYTKMYNLRHLNDMKQLMPMVDWLKYFRAVAPFKAHEFLASNPEILIVEIDYMRRITELLHSMDPRIITNYVFLRFTSTWGGELGERYEDVAQEFHRVMYGKKQKAPRWKDCTSATMHRLQYAAGGLYVKKKFEKTAMEKAKEMLRQIAYPDFILDDGKLDKHYDGGCKVVMISRISERSTSSNHNARNSSRNLKFGYLETGSCDKSSVIQISLDDTDSYSQMVEKLLRWSIEYAYKRLLEPVDRTEYNFNAAVVNAYYSGTSNAIKFPAAILQAPFFHESFPRMHFIGKHERKDSENFRLQARALNYGGIGAVIGHEITHGFDDQGRQFDSVGNLREWWDSGVKKKFVERAQCIIDQYGKIEVPGIGLKVNGKLTQGENIADNGGVKQAFKAYKRYLKKHGEEKRIKGLEEYNNEQMFFMGYATIWCGHMTQDSLINLVLTDPHSPQRYRVNQVLANQPEFAAAFQCDVGTRMNPTERCAVWLIHVKISFNSPAENGVTRLLSLLMPVLARVCPDDEALLPIVPLQLRYGVWPMIHGSNRWSPTHFDLTHLMELMALRALSVFVGVDVALNPRNVARYAISITMGELALGKSSAHYYLDRKKHGKRIEAYRQLMFNETRLIHEDVNMSFEERKTMMYVDEIIEFETKLAKILNDAEEHKDPAKSHHIRRFSDLRLLLPLIDWERYFIHMSPRKVHRYLARNPKIVIENIDYLKRLTKLLQSTEPRIITNYMFVRFSFDRVMLGKKTKTPRWKYCMHKNMERMKFASGALYVRNVFQTVTKKAAENMVADLRATMEELIREGNWMDMKTKEAALEKARMMLQHIAYPEFILNDRLLDKYYRGISIRETDSYSEMVEKFLRWQRRSSYEKLLHPADRNESELDAAEANAFYSSSRNSISM
uniref:Neprilysin-1 (inferred by orthology to a C. elegans protein) n=1 Tax=Nippostrongylus brasiliensis TaxID=27835 RepID=A0A158R2U6_NIPBR